MRFIFKSLEFGGMQIFLLVAFACRSVSIDVEEVKPRWIYKDNKENRNNNNTKSLPDSIHIDLQLESDNITLNLIKQSTEAVKTSFFAPELEGQRSNHPDNEFLGIYKDPLLKATATVGIRNTNGIEETIYMITFTHDKKPISLRPKPIIEDNHFFNNLEEDADASNNNNKGNNYNKGNNKNSNKSNNYENKLLNIDGVLHSLQETPSPTSRHNDHSDEDYVSEAVRKKKIEKRSDVSKRLMTVEIFTVIDNTIFDNFMGLSKAATYEMKREDAKKSIRYVFTHIMERLKETYENIEVEGLKFTTKWVGAFIAEKASDVPYLESSMRREGVLDINAALKNTKEWLNDESAQYNRTDWPKFDFIVTFTRHAIHSVGKWGTQTNTQGFANPGGVCTSERFGVAIYQGFYPSTTLAHELGHSLGGNHDEYNLCNSNSNKYIMSMNTGISGEFSRCSIRQFKHLIEHMDRISDNCLEDAGEDFNHGRERDVFLRLYSGQIFDVDEQCKLAYGPNSSAEINENLNKCQISRCHNGDRLMPMDGTTCGNRAWCQGGKCVPDNKAPRVPEHCVHGDSVKGNSCKETAKLSPSICAFVDEACCATCTSKGAKPKGCSDVISECSSLQPMECYHDYYSNACCKTCRALVSNPSDVDCLYGDKGTDCQDFVPEICHLPTRYCCQTCAGYLSTTNTTISNSPVLKNISSTTTKNCNNGDYDGYLEYVNVWGIKWKVTCQQLMELDSSVCRNDSVQRYCCSSCSGLAKVDDNCEGDNDTVRHVYRSKKFTCQQLVDYMPRLCEQDSVKMKCCKSCGRFTIKPLK